MVSVCRILHSLSRHQCMWKEAKGEVASSLLYVVGTWILIDQWPDLLLLLLLLLSGIHSFIQSPMI